MRTSIEAVRARVVEEIQTLMELMDQVPDRGFKGMVVREIVRQQDIVRVPYLPLWCAAGLLKAGIAGRERLQSYVAEYGTALRTIG